MNDTTLTYKPNCAYRSITVALILLTIFVTVLAFLLWNLKNSIILLLLGIGSALLACYFYRESTVTVFVREHDIETTVFGKIIYSYPWKFFKYTYIVCNYRGFLCLLLSPRVLTAKEQRTHVYFRTIYTKNYRDEVLAIYIERELLEKIQNHIAEHM